MRPVSSPDRRGCLRGIAPARKLPQFTWCAVAASIFGCLPPSSDQEEPTVAYAVEDLSAFGQFVFYRSGAEGFCPLENAVLRAELTRQTGGGIMLETWILAPGIDPEATGASGPGAEAADAIGQRQPARSLTASEVDRVREVFQSVTIGNLQWPMAEHTQMSKCQRFDPCLLNYTQWDGRVLGTDTPCHPADQVLSRQQMNRIIGLLETLRVGPSSEIDNLILADTVEDFSSFDLFTFYRGGGEGFCPPPGAVLRAELRGQANGGITLETWIPKDGVDPELAGASGPTADVADLIGQRRPSRVLTVVEINRVHEVFQSVTIENLWRGPEYTATDDCLGYDPCLWNIVNWDGWVLSTDTPCHWDSQFLSREQMNEIITLLESLRVASDEGA